MGNSQCGCNKQNGGSGEVESELIEDKLDKIATNYILTMDFQSLQQLYKKEYCDKLIVLTSNIIDKHFSDIEVDSLAKRIDGTREKLTFFNKDVLKEGKKKNEKQDKKTNCNEISKFYVKIAHLFAAIVSTINPVYSYQDVFGRTIKRKLYEKNTIPKGAKVTVTKISLCSEKIDALKGEQDFDFLEEDKNEPERKDQLVEFVPEQVAGNANVEINIKPDICSVNLDSNGETNYLDDEPGINELMDLYFDDDYDYKTGRFLGMSPNTKDLFKADLSRFYTTFTGKDEMPDDVKKFSDIKLRDYDGKSVCKNPVGVLKGTYKDQLFLDYANNLRDMIKRVNEKQQRLLNIISRLFTFGEKSEDIRINRELTSSGLQEIVEDTRTLIVELYLQCETDFVEGVKIYEAIVESQIFTTTQKHIEALELEREKLINPSIKVS
jgi:hypothetical protein